MGAAEDVAALVSRGPAFVTTIVTIMNKAGPYVGTVQKVVEDPAFPAVMQRIDTLASTPSSGGTMTTTSSSAPAVPTVGVGLVKAVPVLDAVIFVKRNPIVGFLAIGGVLAAIAGVGYHFGKRRR